MKKKLFSIDFFIVILTLIASAYIIYARLKYHYSQYQLKEKFLATRSDFSSRTTPISTEPLDTTTTQEDTKPSRQTRNILFSIKTNAKKVSLIGDFNDWTPTEMTRDTRGIWSIAVKLSPGEYAYNFIVDGRPVRDFNNPRTTNTGRGFISSLIEVKPLE